MPYIKHVVFDITAFLILLLPVIIALIIISKLKVADEMKKFKKMCIYIIVSIKVVQFITPALLRNFEFYTHDFYKGIWYVAHFLIVITIGVFLYNLIKQRKEQSLLND